MRPVRAPLSVFLAVIAAVLFAIGGHGQDKSLPGAVLGVGLPAIDRGVVSDESRRPGSRETVTRRSIRSSSSDRSVVGAGYVPGRVIVKFRDGVSTETRLSALSTVSRTASMSERPSYANFDIIRIDSGEDPEAVARAFAQRPDVEYAQPLHRFHTEFVPNDPLYASQQWNLPLIDMEHAWDIQPQAGSSITVAVLDTGIAYTNAMLTERTLPFVDDAGRRYPSLGVITVPYTAAPQLGPSSRFVAPFDFISNTNTPLDFDGHGTHVSGTIGQLTNDGVGTAGVAFNVKLMPVKVLASAWDVIFGFATDVGGTDDQVARGIRYATDSGAKVINMSLGGSGPPGSAPAIEDAIRYAVGKGVFVAVAAGNDFEDGNPPQVISEIASRVAGAVSVAAVDPAKAHAYYSSSGTYIELAAPGGSERGFGSLPSQGYVWQQTFDYQHTDTFLLPPSRYTAPRFDVIRYVGYIGTSQATPHVAGVAAMLMQQGVTNPAAIEDALERFATDLGTAGRDPLFGFGLIEARTALRGLGLAK